jgi:hypothetical protein
MVIDNTILNSRTRIAAKNFFHNWKCVSPVFVHRFFHVIFCRFFTLPFGSFSFFVVLYFSYNLCASFGSRFLLAHFPSSHRNSAFACLSEKPAKQNKAASSWARGRRECEGIILGQFLCSFVGTCKTTLSRVERLRQRAPKSNMFQLESYENLSTEHQVPSLAWLASCVGRVEKNSYLKERTLEEKSGKKFVTRLIKEEL